MGATTSFSDNRCFGTEQHLEPPLSRLSRDPPLFILSHDNGIDEHGRSICKRASKINSYLMVNGIRTYFGNYEETCSLDITQEDNVCFILFLTKQYVTSLLEQLEKNYKLTEIVYVPGTLSNFVEVTIRMILNRHNSGNCRIIPVIMEEHALTPVHKETFDDIVLNFVWQLDYTGDDTFDYVSHQILDIITQWSQFDLIESNHGHDCDAGSENSVTLPDHQFCMSTAVNNSMSQTSSASNVVVVVMSSNDVQMRERNMPWSSYKKASPLPMPLPEPVSPQVKAFPEDLTADYVAQDSIAMLDKQKLFDWLVHFFDFPGPTDVEIVSGTALEIADQFNFNRVEHIIHLLIADGVASLEQFFKLYIDTHDDLLIYKKYFRKAVLNEAVDHHEHHTSVYEGDLKTAKQKELVVKGKDARGLQYLVEAMRLHVPSVVVSLSPVVKFDDLPDVLYGEHDHSRATPENSVLYGICPTLVTAASTLQELTLVMQLCVQFVSMSPVISGFVGGSRQGDTRQSPSGRATLLDAISSKVILSSVPTLSIKHPINIRLAALQKSVVTALYGEEYVGKSDSQLQRRMEDISAMLGLSQVPEAASPIGSRHYIAKEAARKLARHSGYHFDMACCLLTQAMQELAARFNGFITNRIIADDGISLPPAAYMQSGSSVDGSGGSSSSPTMTGTPPVDSHAFINPIDEFCIRMYGATVLCDAIACFVSISKHLHGELNYRRSIQPRRFYRARNMGNVEALLDDDFLELQRRRLYSVFCVQSLVALNSLFTKLSQTATPVVRGEPVRVTNDSEYLVSGDWKYEGLDVGDSGYNCYDQTDYTGSGHSSPYKKSHMGIGGNRSKAKVNQQPLSILLRLLYSHNVNNIMACCQYNLCDNLVALLRPSVLTQSEDNPLAELITVLYSVTLLHMTSCEIGCRKLSMCKVGSILEYKMIIYGADKCGVNHLISWPTWLLAAYRYVGLFSTLWITTSNLVMNENASKLLIGSSKVCCENMVVALCHGYQQLFRYHDEEIEIQFQLPDVKPIVRAGSALIIHPPSATSTLAVGASASTHLSKAEVELVVFNLLSTMNCVAGMAVDGSRPAAAVLHFEQLVSFDVMRFIVQSIFNNLSTVLSATNASLCRIRHVPPADLADLADESINSSNLYVLVGACKAIYGLVSNSSKIKLCCLDNSGIKILSNAFSIVYADQELLVEVLAPLLRLLLVENSATVLIAESVVNIHARKRLFAQFCEGKGHMYLTLAMEKYFTMLIKKFPLIPGSIDVCQVVLRDLLILTFWVLYHGNVKKTAGISADHAKPSTENTACLVSLLTSTGLNDIMSKIFTQYTNRLLDVFRHFTASETTDEVSEDTRSVGNPASDTSSLAAFPHPSTSGRMGRHHRGGLEFIDEGESLGDLDAVSTQSQAAAHMLSIAQISEDELIYIVTVDYVCKILCFQVTNENCRLLLGSTDGFCQALMNILTLACKLMIVYEKIEREHMPFEEDNVAYLPMETSPEVQKKRRATFKSSLIYIISECCFIFRALTVESCNQTHILQQPLSRPPQYKKSEAAASSTPIENSSGGMTQMLSAASPYSTWYMCILAVMKLYMYIHTIPVPKSKAKRDPFINNGNVNISPAKDPARGDDVGSIDYSTYSAQNPHDAHDNDSLTTAGESGKYDSHYSVSTDSSMTRITATVPTPHFASLLTKTAELGSPSDWCSSMTDVSLEHVLHGALYLTCGTGISASVMDLIFGHVTHSTEVNDSSPMSFHRNDACTVMTQLFQEFNLFIRLFTVHKTALTLIIWEVLRRQSLIWLFPYHNTTIPKNFLYPKKKAPLSHGHGHSHAEYDELTFSDSDSDNGNGVYGGDGVCSAQSRAHRGRHGCKRRDNDGQDEDYMDDGESIEQQSLISFDAVEDYRAAAFKEGVLDTVHTPRGLAGSGAVVHFDEDDNAYWSDNGSIDEMSGAGSDSCADRNYTARMEDERKPGEKRLTHHNNYTSSSMKYLAALRPNINISMFLPFSKSGSRINAEGDDIHGNDSDSVSTRSSSKSSYFAAKLSSWIIGGGTKKEQKAKANVIKSAKLSNFSGRKTAVAPMALGVATAAGAQTVPNRKNPVHHMLWSFHTAYNVGALHERHAPNNAFAISEAPHLYGPSRPCIYDMIYATLATCCGLSQFAGSSVHALQLVIIILQGYIHDKDAYRQLCKVLYQRKIFDVCMKYLLVICDPPLNANTMESLAALDLAPQHQNPGRVDAEKIIEYNGKVYVCSPQAAARTYDAFRDMGGRAKSREIGSRDARGALPPLTAVPYVNMTDPLSQFIDEIDCGFPTVRSEVEGHHHRNMYGNATPRNNARDSNAPPPVYPIEVEMDMIKYIGSMCSYAAVDEDTRYILREVLYAEQIFAKVVALPRYELIATKFSEPKLTVDIRGLMDPLNDLERREEIQAEIDRERDAIRHSRQSFIPQVSTTSFLPLEKVQQIRKVVDTVTTNLNWKDPRLNRYQQLEEVLDRMTGEFRGRNLCNTDKRVMLDPGNNFLSKKAKRRKNRTRIG